MGSTEIGLMRNIKTIDEFNIFSRQMPDLLTSLELGPALNRNSLKGIPESGIYVFYDGGVPIYVGRSDRMRKRLMNHGMPSSDHNKATFAFILAVENAQRRGIDTSLPRATLQHVPEFRVLYTLAKERVSKMEIRVIEVHDPIGQTVFEVYAALALATPYNKFENH
jgi:hypothetical protein